MITTSTNGGIPIINSVKPLSLFNTAKDYFMAITDFQKKQNPAISNYVQHTQQITDLLQQCQTNLSTLKTTNNSLITQIANLQADQQTLTDKIVELNNTQSQNQTTIAEQLQSISDLTVAKADLSSQITNLNNQAGQYQQTIVDLTNARTQLQQTVQQLQEQIQTSQGIAQINTLNAQIKTLTDQISSLSTENAANIAKLQDLGSKYTACQQTIENLQQQVRQLTMVQTQISNTNKQLNDQLAVNSETIDNLKIMLSQVQSQYDTLKSEYDNLVKKYSVLQEQLAQSQSQYANCQDTLKISGSDQELTNALLQCKNTAETLTKQLSQSAFEIQKYQDTIKSNTQQIDTLQQQLTGSQDKIKLIGQDQDKKAKSYKIATFVLLFGLLSAIIYSILLRIKIQKHIKGGSLNTSKFT